MQELSWKILTWFIQESLKIIQEPLVKIMTKTRRNSLVWSLLEPLKILQEPSVKIMTRTHKDSLVRFLDLRMAL